MNVDHWYRTAVGARRFADTLQRPQMVHAHPRDEWHADGSDTRVECTLECVGLLPQPTSLHVRRDDHVPTVAERLEPHVDAMRRIIGSAPG